MHESEFVHLCVRLRPGVPSLLAWPRARWLWGKLRRLFPEAAGAVLMPDHIHLVLPAGAAGARREHLVRTLGHYGRRFHPGGRVWRPVDGGRAVLGRSVLRPTLRYLALNPCRAGLTDDPLAWLWSTYRDGFGAAVDPWVSPARLAALLAPGVTGSLEPFHRYVSARAAVAPRGTPPPGRGAAEPLRLEVLQRGVAAAYRLRPAEAMRARAPRNLFLCLAWEQGWRRRRLLAAWAGLHPCSVNRIVAGPPPALEARRAVLLCAADVRLSGARLWRPPLYGRPSARRLVWPDEGA